MVLAVMESAHFDKVVREVFVEKVTFDKRPQKKYDNES